MRQDPKYQDGRLVHSVWKKNKKQLRKEKREAVKQLQKLIEDQQERCIVYEDDLDCDN